VLLQPHLLHLVLLEPLQLTFMDVLLVNPPIQLTFQVVHMQLLHQLRQLPTLPLQPQPLVFIFVQLDIIFPQPLLVQLVMELHF